MNRIRADQVVALRGVTVRSVRWPPVLSAVLIVAAVLSWRDDWVDSLGSTVTGVRMTAVLLAVGTAFVLDDAASITVAASPTPLWWRRQLRYAVAGVFVLPAWTVVLVYASARQPGLPWPRLTLELLALLLFGLAAGAAAMRWRDLTDPGMTAALAILGFTLLGAQLPQRVALFAAPGSASWEPSTWRWAGILLVAGAVLVAASRDPARAWPIDTTRLARLQ